MNSERSMLRRPALEARTVMSTDRWYGVLIELTEENDGWTFQRRGPGTRKKTLSLRQALESWGSQHIIEALEEALAQAKAHGATPPASTPKRVGKVRAEKPKAPEKAKNKQLTAREAAVLGVSRDATPQAVQAAARGKIESARATKQYEKRRLKAGRTPPH